ARRAEVGAGATPARGTPNHAGRRACHPADPHRPGQLDDLGVGFGLADHGLAGRLPGAHAAVDVHRVPPVAVEVRGGAGGATATPAHHVDVLFSGQFTEPAGQFAHGDVQRLGGVPGRPLVVLTHVEQGHVGRDLGHAHRG